MASGAEVRGGLPVAPQTVHRILDDEARKAGLAAAKLTAKAMNTAAPKGPTGRLAKSHKPSVRRTATGVVAGARRDNKKAWYGRIVEGGRKAGVSRKGRHYPGAEARPFSAKAAFVVQAQAERLIEEGADRAAARIAARF